jgi:precorrin-6Y C5,15-methyltransferase (decarboxylating)
MQLAFARVKETWDEAYLCNVATQPLEAVVEKLRTAAKAGLFTSEDVPPGRIAQALLDRRIDYFSAYVCENLGSPDERVTFGELADVAGQDFSPLNVMILVRQPDAPDRPVDRIGQRLFGNDDEMYLQSHPKRGLLTPMEVRTLALAEMDLGPTSIVWDVGAGSGSVAIEAAQIAHGGSTYAIEMDADDHRLISDNAARFAVKNLIPILGQAPDAWAKLPDPDAIFVGGTGRGAAGICEEAYQRLKPGGRLVANFSTIENLAAVHAALHRLAGDVKLRMISISHGTYQLERVRFEAMNPTFLVSVVKQ